jgi:hypothetical protein
MEALHTRNISTEQTLAVVLPAAYNQGVALVPLAERRSASAPRKARRWLEVDCKQEPAAPRFPRPAGEGTISRKAHNSRLGTSKTTPNGTYGIFNVFSVKNSSYS